MGEFRFKRFTVQNDRAAMRVNTDGVLLGAAMTILPEDRCLLDIGTGTGTIALMAAQRLNDMKESIENNQERCFHITGIDIDKDSADEAEINFKASPWASNLHSAHKSLFEFTSTAAYGDRMTDPEPEMLFDLIFSNPPYFESSLKAPDERRRNARHTDTLSYKDILEAASRHLRSSGRLSLILPADQECDIIRQAASFGLYPFNILYIRTTPKRAVSRIITEFSRSRIPAAKGYITIQDGGRYTAQYLSIVKDFLTIEPI